MASIRFSTLVVLLLCCSCIASALARQLQAKPARPLAPVQIGDGTRVLRKSHMQAKGGAIAALGRPVLAELKRKARFSGTVQQLAKQMDTDSDLVSLLGVSVCGFVFFACCCRCGTLPGVCVCGRHNQPAWIVPALLCYLL